MTVPTAVLRAVLAAWLLLALVAGAGAQEVVTLRVASTFATELPLIGEGLRELAAKVRRASGGTLELVVHEPGDLVPAAETVQAVADGTIEAAWAGAGWFSRHDSAFDFFSAVPFGPEAGEYLAWMFDGGGLDLARELFHGHGVHDLPCALVPPEASGWFRHEIRSVDDLRGLRMRFFGLGARTVARLGVETVQLPPGDIRAALEAGQIDAAEFSAPSIDQHLQLIEGGGYYYFPGWHQQATLFDLFVNHEVWSALSEQHRAILEIACGDTIRETIARGEATQWAAIRAMQDQGVAIRRWAPEILVAFEAAWHTVLQEEAARNPNFRRVHDSYVAFHERYRVWQVLSTLR